MSAPGTQDIRKPLLEAFRDEAPHSFAINDYLELMSESFGKNLNEMSSIEKNLFRNNINQAKTYLKHQGLLSNPSKGTYMITPKGLKILEDNPDVINDDYFQEKIKQKTLTEKINDSENEILLGTEPVTDENNLVEPENTVEIEEGNNVDFTENEFENAVEEVVEPEVENIVEDVEITPSEKPEEDITPASDEENITIEENNSDNVEDISETETEIEEPAPLPEPEPDPKPEPVVEQAEQHTEAPEHSGQELDAVFEKYNTDLSNAVLKKVANLPSDRFEILVIDLLSKMGYFAFQTARYSNDTPGSELIHGVIIDNNNPGTKPIYIQARKLSPSKTVGRADVNDFIEALKEKGGTGIFATTATFSEQAKITATDERIMLIDGSKLASLMIANNFCVNIDKIFEVKSIDLDSFGEYED
ncbi:MAG: restriction endonuclease [Synergistaceae bacterium]|nr:restriction endonuclease [Synergistaceae bacterium]